MQGVCDAYLQTLISENCCVYEVNMYTLDRKFVRRFSGCTAKFEAVDWCEEKYANSRLANQYEGPVIYPDEKLEKAKIVITNNWRDFKTSVNFTTCPCGIQFRSGIAIFISRDLDALISPYKMLKDDFMCTYWEIVM